MSHSQFPTIHTQRERLVKRQLNQLNKRIFPTMLRILKTNRKEQKKQNKDTYTDKFIDIVNNIEI